MANLITWFTPVFIFLVTSGQGSAVIVQKGEPTKLQCVFPTNVTSITWQLVVGNSTANLSACNFTEGHCKDTMPTLYQGQLSSSGSNNAAYLSVNSSRTNETHFVCLPDNGLDSIFSELEVFAWPKKPVCRQNFTNTYVDYQCVTYNVYPNVTAVLHRNETELMESDFDANHTECLRGDYGSGSQGDYPVVCKWRIPLENMFAENTFFVDMMATVSNMSVINRTAARSDDITTTFDIPEPFLPDDACPIGPGVFGDTFLIGTNTTCKCVPLLTDIPGAFVRWFTQGGRIVGVESNGTSTVTISYNHSDPDQSYECRPFIPLKANVSSFIIHPKFINYPMIVEKGQPTTLECSFGHNVTSITWQMLVGLDIQVNLSTCSFVDNKCTQKQPSLYQGFISSSGSDRVVSLTISSVRKNETQFVCLTDNGLKSNITLLEVYAWPTKPQCKMVAITTNDFTFVCTTDNVYPGVEAAAHRRGRDFTEMGSNLTNFDCYNDPIYEGTEGDYTVNCAFIFTIKNMPLENHIYVAMAARVSNQSAITRKPSISDDMIPPFRVPVVILRDYNCPVGPGVIGDTILNGTAATCKCELSSKGSLTGFPRWYTKDHRIVGDENQFYGYSVLNFSYNSPDPKQSYECWPITPLNANGTPVIYKPIFVSASQNVITRLQPLLIILGVVCSVIASGLA